ncbi:DMT family transporter [Pyrococcus kukulkanii]|uniref:Multidrug DMT transporter permease n=1 Tax=Pyrococcus kukulkanii TaxID=1609559 RepID=A0A127BB91_9EURY|nr:DMT family transporter [Pyrococcus kukulkanii]AMM54455.1 multidrug DMT transporter permease [Pyrococcus kukulkanii]
MDLILGVGLALGAAFVWALTSVLSKISMAKINPVSLNTLRLFISSAFYIPLIIFLRLIPNKGWEWWAIVIVSGIIGFTIADWLFLEGMNIIGVSRASILVTPHPILTMVLAHYLLGRPLNASIAAGAVMIVIAVLILVSEAMDNKEMSWKGIAFVVTAEVLWTVAVLITDWLVHGESAVLITGLRISSGALGALVFASTLREDIRIMNAKDWGLVVVITVLGTILGQYFFIKSISLVSSSIATPVTESSPVMAALMAVAFLKEKFTKRLAVSLVLTTLGITLIGLA